MNFEIDVRKVSFEPSKGYIHQVSYNSGNTYSDIMNKISYVCRTYKKGQMIMVNKDVYPHYVATYVPGSNVTHLTHMYKHGAVIPDIRDHMKKILNNDNCNEFVIAYETVVLQNTQHVKNYVTLGGR